MPYCTTHDSPPTARKGESTLWCQECWRLRRRFRPIRVLYSRDGSLPEGVVRPWNASVEPGWYAITPTICDAPAPSTEGGVAHLCANWLHAMMLADVWARGFREDRSFWVPGVSPIGDRLST
jgi:hypothetical protein